LTKKIITIILSAILMLSLCGCDNNSELESYRPITDLNNLEGRKIGVNMGWAADYLLSGRDDLILYRYDTSADMLMALCYKQLDAVATEDISAKQLLAASTGLRQVEGQLSEDGFVALFRIGAEDIRDDFDDWITTFRETDEYKAWSDRCEDFDGVNYEWPGYEWPTEGKPFVVGGYDIDFPMVFVEKDETPSGYEMELLYMFCRDCGYAPDIKLMEEEGIFVGLTNGTIDSLFGDFSELYAEDSATVGITASVSYREAPIVVLEIADPDNLSIAGVADMVEDSLDEEE